ncbi:hypothetical protein QFC21_005490 [Naganishia friedmannii]|uniref:Uncharacterized protein n=1 Tax=Naganishia friedmannii TaxID=89922 RepID=A0ACC2V8D1_9TREE|nr:hypothetical protein QFC21_005490 [Naganishia friedmannii]
MDHRHDHLAHHLHTHEQYTHRLYGLDHEDDQTLDQFVNLDGPELHHESLHDDIDRSEDPANAPIEVLLNAIRNSPSPLSAESDHYSQIDGSDSIHGSIIHSSHIEDQNVTQHYPPHGTDASLSDDAAIDHSKTGDAVSQPVQEQDHASYHAIPEQSDMQELAEKYIHGHEESAGREEAGDYVIEEAYSESKPTHQTGLENTQGQDYIPAAAQQCVDRQHDGYLGQDGSNQLHPNGPNAELHYASEYPEEPKQDQPQDSVVYDIATGGDDKAHEKERDLAMESELDALRSAFAGSSERNNTDEPPRDATSNAFRGLLEASRMLGAASGQRSTTATSTKYHEQDDNAGNEPTELERALRSFAIPTNGTKLVQPARVGTSVRRQTSAVARPENSTSYAGPAAVRGARKLSLPLSSQVVPQKRKARSEVSPDDILTRMSSPDSVAGPSRPKPSGSAQPIPPTPAVHARGRATTPPFLEEMRRTKISRMFAATTGPGGSRIPEQQMSFSTITLLHGHIVQKSYLKEKRFLCPPPVVRMAGSVSDTVETISLQILNQDVGPDIPIISNNQGVKFNVPGKEEDARAYLREGLYFSGLYASRTGKAKSLKLRLNVFQPGGTDPRSADDAKTSFESGEAEMVNHDQIETEAIQPNTSADQEALRRQRNLNSLLLNAGHEGSLDAEERQAAIDAMIEHDPLFNMSAYETNQHLVDARHQDSHGESGPPYDDLSMLTASPMSNENLANGHGERSNQKPDAQGRKKARQLKPDDQRSNMAGSATASGVNGEEDGAGQSSKVIEEMEGNSDQPSLRPWATFDGLPMQIVSKPTQSKRPNFAFKRTNASYLYVGDPISLWSRINSQSVRTKYLYVEHGKLVGMPSDWSAFVIDVVKRGEPPGGLPEKNRPDPGVITFNSTVILRDIHSDYRTEPLLLIKIMSGKPVLNEFGPVSELNKVAFAKVVAGQGKWYLRAPGHDRDKLEDENGKPLPRIRKRIRGKKDTVNSVVKKRVAPALDTEDNFGDPSAVRFEPSKVSVEVIDGQSVEGEYFDDFITWTISGVTEHTYTFFEGRHEVGDFSTVFRRPLTPMPILLDIPEYRAMENTITMTVTNFYYDDDNPIFRGKPLLLYLGAIGPLKFRSYRSTAPAVANNTPHDAGAAYLNSFPAIPIDGGEEVPPEARPYSSVPSTVPHTIIVIHLPAPKEMWDATRIERERQMQLDHLQLAHDLKYRQEDVVDDTFAEPDWAPLEDEERKPRSRRSEEHTEMVGGDDRENDISSSYKQEKAQGIEADFAPGDKTLGRAHQSDIGHSLSSMEMAHSSRHDLQSEDDSMADIRVEDFPPFGPAEMGLDDSTSAVMDAMMNGHNGQEEVDSLMEQQPYEFDHNVTDDMHQLFTAAALQAATQDSQDMMDPSTMLHGDALDEDEVHQHHHHHEIDHEQSSGVNHSQNGMDTDTQYEFYASEAIDSNMHVEEPDRSDVMDAHHADRYSVRHDSLSTITEADTMLHSADTGVDSELQTVLNSEDQVPSGASKIVISRPASPFSVATTLIKGKKGKLPISKEEKPVVIAPSRSKQPRKPRTPQIKPTLTSSALHDMKAPDVRITRKPFTACPLYAQGHVNRASQLGGSSLPLLFLRQSDGTGYHTGKNVVIQKLYAGSDSETWSEFPSWRLFVLVIILY